MKFLALLVSLLLGSAVLLFLVQPWEWIEGRDGGMRKITESSEPAPSAAAEEVAQAKDAAPVGGETASPVADPEPAAPAGTDADRSEGGTRLLLPGEQAEAERRAALTAQDHAITPDQPTKRYFKVKVRDAGTLEVDLPTAETLVIRLDGIEAREADAACTKEDGTTWPCGARARAALTLLVRSRAVTCTIPSSGETSDFTARCKVMDQDLSTWLVRRGWATPLHDTEPELVEALQAAKSEGVGLWWGD